MAHNWENKKSVWIPPERPIRTQGTAYNVSMKQRNPGPQIKCGSTDGTPCHQFLTYAIPIKSMLLKCNKLSCFHRQVLHSNIYGGLSRFGLLELERASDSTSFRRVWSPKRLPVQGPVGQTERREPGRTDNKLESVLADAPRGWTEFLLTFPNLPFFHGWKQSLITKCNKKKCKFIVYFYWK